MNLIVKYQDLIFLILIISMFLIQYLTKKTINKYSNILNSTNLCGYDVADQIISKYGLNDITITDYDSNLNDFYNPYSKELHLSRNVCEKSSIASVAITAHECGHAIQDKNNYIFSKLRNKIVPFMQIVSNISWLIVFLMIFMPSIFALILIIVSFIIELLFQIFTLPMEINASTIAMKIIKKDRLLNKHEFNSARKVLTIAAMTYASSLFTLIIEMMIIIQNLILVFN